MEKVADRTPGDKGLVNEPTRGKGGRVEKERKRFGKKERVEGSS